MDKTSSKQSSGRTWKDAISLDFTDDSDTNDNPTRSSPPSNKRRRTSSDNDRFVTTSIQCPIKLFATLQDESLRQEHPNTKDHWSYTQCWTLREMLGLDLQDKFAPQDRIEWLLLSNYIINFEFLLDEIPELLSIPTVLVVYGHSDTPCVADYWKQKRGAEEERDEKHTKQVVVFLPRNPSAPVGSSSNPLRETFPFGCHHTKLFLVGYSSGRLRVIVHTSNLRYNDVHLKCQGAYLQDFYFKSTEQMQSFDTSDFEETLLSYLETYGYTQRHRWRSRQQATINEMDSYNNTNNNDYHKSTDDDAPCSLLDHLCKYDFSTAKGVLIPSTPGNHKLSTATSHQGHLKVREAIATHVVRRGKSHQDKDDQTRHYPPRLNSSYRRPIVCQFSSIGSLSQRYLESLWNAWDVESVRSSQPPSKNSATKASQKPNSTSKRQLPSSSSSLPFLLELVYPTRNEIRQSVEGISGGGSVPGQSKNVGKPFLQSLYRRWTKRHTATTTSITTTNALSSSSSSSSPSLSRTKENETFGKERNVPHIKTYYQVAVANDNNGMEWFMLTSHNLSKAAWGEVQNGMRGERLRILHWELGIWISPNSLGVDYLIPYEKNATTTTITTFLDNANNNNNNKKLPKMVATSKHTTTATTTTTASKETTRNKSIPTTTMMIPLPYSFRPEPYGPKDEAWAMDTMLY